MRAAHRQPPTTHRPGAGLAWLLAVVLMLPCSRAALSATAEPTAVKPTTMLKPPVQSASTGSLKTSRQALLKQRSSVIGVNNRHPGKIVGATTPPPKIIVTKRFLPK